MTLNITLVSRHIIFQVSDRRFTDHETLQPVDDNGNKAIVLGCRDGNAMVTFTGLATFRVGADTHRLDHWLVDRLQEHRIPEVNVEEAVRFIANASGDLFGRLSPDSQMAHTYVIAGWSYTEPPVAKAWVVSNGSTQGREFTVDPPFTPDGNVTGIQVTGLRHAFTRSIRRRLMRTLSGRHTPDAIEAALVGAIREAASNSIGIGKDCMSIALSASRDARATYYPESGTPHTFGPLCLWSDSGTIMFAGDFDIQPGPGYHVAVGHPSCPFHVVLGQQGAATAPTRERPLVIEGTMRVSGPLSPGQSGTILQIRVPAERDAGQP